MEVMEVFTECLEEERLINQDLIEIGRQYLWPIARRPRQARTKLYS